MKWKLINDSDEKTFALIFDTGDEVVAGLIEFAKQHRISAAQLAGIGACRRVTVGFFEVERKDYKKIQINEQVEVMSLLGNISLSENGEPKVHGHIVIGKSDGTAHGGHLLEAYVRSTLEVFLVVYPGQLQRKMNDHVGLELIDLTE